MKKNYFQLKFLMTFGVLLMFSFGFSQEPIIQPVFTTFQSGQVFTAITTDVNNNVWAGTTSQGIFFLNQADQTPTFSALNIGTNPVIGSTRITSMAKDNSGNIWIAHEGINTTGGVGGIEKINVTTLAVQHFGPGINARGFTVYSEGDGLPTRRVQQIVVDPNNKVWAAHRYHDVTSSPDYIVTPGSICSRMADVDGPFENYSTWNDWQNRTTTGIMLEGLPYPAYTYNPPISVTPDSRTVNAISVDSSFIYISVFGYNDSNGVFSSTNNFPVTYLKPRLIKYTNTAVPQFVAEVTTQQAGFSTSGGIFNGVYANGSQGVWVTTPVAGNGFSVFKNGVWTNLNSSNFPNIIPAGTSFNTKAIWGNQYGNVFLGTNKGLIVYDGRGSVTDQESYTLYNQERHGLISNNILAGASETIVDDSEEELDYKLSQWIATDNGIIRANIGSVPTDDEYETDVASRNMTSQNTNSSQNINARRVLAEMERRNNIPGGDDSYHEYTIVTEICDKTRPLDPNCTLCVPCTQEHVYRAMQENSKFQIASPLVMSQDVMPNGFLLDLSEQDFIDINNTVNTKTEHIVNASEIFATSSPSVQQKYNNSNSNWTPDLTTVPSTISAQLDKNALYAEQNNYNKGVGETIDKIECKNDKTYRLYNSPSFIGGRVIFQKASGVCSYPLESVLYDPITMFVYDKTFTIINFTQQGHALDPGMVARSVVEVNNKIFVVTKGTGYHFCKGSFINIPGNRLADLSRRLNLVEGCIIFKNADIALKKFINGQN